MKCSILSWSSLFALVPVQGFPVYNGFMMLGHYMVSVFTDFHKHLLLSQRPLVIFFQNLSGMFPLSLGARVLQLFIIPGLSTLCNGHQPSCFFIHFHIFVFTGIFFLPKPIWNVLYVVL